MLQYRISYQLPALCMALFLNLWPGFAQEGADRKIERSDLIIIEVFNEPSLTVERRVQTGGTIRYPLLGDIEVAGKSTADVASLLKEKLGEDYLVNPEVTVTVKEYRAQIVSVIGKVNRPGPVQIPQEQKMDIVQAIAQAGGFQPTANENRINFSRDGRTTVYRFKDLIEIKDDSKKVWLAPGDVIEVKESLF